MTQTQVLKRLRRSHWIELEELLKKAYKEGVEAGPGAGTRTKPALPTDSR